MDQKTPQLMAILEGLLFCAGEEGLSLIQIQSALETVSRQEITDCLRAYREKLESEERGIELVQYAGRWKLVARDYVYPYGEKMYQTLHAPLLSQAAMETLAIIAYRQPITRVEIENIRGVGCDAILKKLVARDLISANTRSDAVGKPLLYCVTDYFLDSFGMESLQELPELEDHAIESLFEAQTDQFGDNEKGETSLTKETSEDEFGSDSSQETDREEPDLTDSSPIEKKERSTKENQEN